MYHNKTCFANLRIIGIYLYHLVFFHLYLRYKIVLYYNIIIFIHFQIKKENKICVNIGGNVNLKICRRCVCLRAPQFLSRCRFFQKLNWIVSSLPWIIHIRKLKIIIKLRDICNSSEAFLKYSNVTLEHRHPIYERNIYERNICRLIFTWAKLVTDQITWDRS